MSSKIIIPDISFYQDDPTTPQGVDFRIMRERTPGVIIRAGQNTWTDTRFVEHWRRAKEAGLKRGAYWFYDSRAEPKKQAVHFAELLEADPPELGAWGDFEDRYGGAYDTWKHRYDFMENLSLKLPDTRIGIYTGYYYWLERVTGISKERLEYFARYPLWIAAYNPSAPLIPPPFKGYMFWQFTDNGDGKLYGVESKNIDLNYFFGDEADFELLFGKVERSRMMASFGGEMVEYRR